MVPEVHWTHTLNFFPEENKPERSPDSFLSTQQGNTHVRNYKFLKEEGFYSAASFSVYFFFPFWTDLCVTATRAYKLYSKIKSCPNWRSIVWCFDGQFSATAAKFHFEELKQKRVWMEAFKLGDRFAFQSERYLTKDQFVIFTQIQICFTVQLHWLV